MPRLCAPTRPLAIATLVGLLGVVGCGQQSARTETPKDTSGPSSVAVVNPTVDPPASIPSGANSTHPIDALHLPFKAVTRSEDLPPPAGANRPPDMLASKKSTYKVYKAVMEHWDRVRFTTPEGKKIDYVVSVETTLGTFKIAMKPELAPNHVRNFLALAEVGYYDGLFVDRIRQEEENGRVLLQTIELGCPLGSGEPGNESIGYWLKEENTSELATHEEGTVGLCRGTEPDSGACRFYVTLNKAPFLDGNFTVFGKVIEGMDVVRKIHAQPVIILEQERDNAHRPEKPIGIVRVTVHRGP
jgi:peptidyl-prolyl cis-trans isomerase B (cyclophilin B)